MGLCRSAVVAGSLVLVATTAHAAVPRTGRRVIADELTAMPAAGVSKPLRTQRGVRFATRATPAWQKFTSAVGGTWHAAWDPATGVPNRIWGSGIATPGANGSAAIAERAARAWLAAHIELVAPGALATDFVLVSNHSDGDIRSLGFAQFAGGLRVVGGQLSFRFKRDRLFLIGSEALPHVAFARPRAQAAPQIVFARAADNTRRELGLPMAPVTPLSGEVVLPLVADDAVLGYRLAATVMIDGGADGRYLAYVEPSDGRVLAVHQQNRYATGTLLYRSVDRHPGRARVDRPAPHAHVEVGGSPQTTTAAGGITWTPDVVQTLTTAVVGNFATIVNKATGGLLAATELTVPPGGTTVWDASTDEHADAQLQAYLATNKVKDYVRDHLDPAMPKLDEPITVNVNIAQSCNAFFDGKSINFFQASMQCQNTGLLEDVVFHEFGHAVHSAEIIENVGGFDGAMSEGAADFLAASITNDPAMGRGFFYDDEPLRLIDPVGSEYTWPKDIQEIHHTGLIYGGTFWDLRKALIAEYGATEGVAITNKLFLATLRRSVSIPSSMFEALAADDDDGDLSNGTPHECFIRDAYGRHGLRTATGVVTGPGSLTTNALGTIVRVDLSGLSERCTGDELDKVELVWKPGYLGRPSNGSTLMTAASETRFWGQMPLAINDVMYYSARITFKDESVLSLADNLADPYYSLYQGNIVPLYCTSFETDPFAEGWTTGIEGEGVSPWEWGHPSTGATDPPVAYSGTGILAQKLAGDYPPQSATWVRLPEIFVGQWSDVHLQYRRWLAVEDSHFDKAQVTVAGKRAWINATSNMGDSSSLHHIDREWRFHDVALNGYGFGHTVNVGFELTTDEGLELGGWQLDDVCVVANIHSICGDGVKTPTEQCDDGGANRDAPGACRTYCRLPSCGDSILDATEVCDEGPGGTRTCTADCQTIEPDVTGGCCETGRGEGWSLGALGAAVCGMLLRRRRRAACD